MLLAGPVAPARSECVIGPTGVDKSIGVRILIENGAILQLTFGFRAELPVAVRVSGDHDSVKVPEDFHLTQTVVLQKDDRETSFELPALGNGYAHETIAFQDAGTGAGTDRFPWPDTYTTECARWLAQAIPRSGLDPPYNRRPLGRNAAVAPGCFPKPVSHLHQALICARRRNQLDAHWKTARGRQ